MFEGAISYERGRDWDIGSSKNEFVNSILDETTWNIARDELTVRKYDLASCILLTLSVRNICLTSETIANKMTCMSAKYTS